MLSLLLAATLTSTVELPSVRDNTMYEESSDLSNGAGGDVFTGKTFSNLRRALLAFDVTAIPAGSVVQSATLHLTLTQAPPVMDIQDVSVYRLTADWGEADSVAPAPGGTGAPAERGDATWGESFYQNTPWATAGGDFAASASAVTSVRFTPGVDYAWASSVMLADVQGWVDDPAANHGWILIGNEIATRTARRFASRENATAAFRPRLVIEYTAPVAGPGAVPDGGERPGTPLTLARSGSTLSMSWGPSCRPAADYVVQAGTLTALRTGTYDDVPLTCTTGGLTSHTTAVPVANAYFLVLPLDGGAAGSRGLNGAGAERPQGASGCAPPSASAPVCPLLFAAAHVTAEEDVALCHYPPGNPASAQTISVSESSLPAHLQHGDTLGACGAGCGEGLHDCGGTCVSNDSTATCGSSCTPCRAPLGATATCDGTACGIDCNGTAINCGGQCVNTSTDPSNCGGCGYVCSGVCSGGYCS